MHGHAAYRIYRRPGDGVAVPSVAVCAMTMVRMPMAVVSVVVLAALHAAVLRGIVDVTGRV
jgi:hypothetical protein